MYQTLIWALVSRHDAGGLGATLDTEDLKGLADTLVDGVRRNLKLGRNLL